MEIGLIVPLLKSVTNKNEVLCQAHLVFRVTLGVEYIKWNFH